MIIKKITNKTTSAIVSDCYVGDGYIKKNHGSLPDIDSDFSADRRDEVKAYLERRYNKQGLQRVFSAGTFTTEKIKSAIKDVARTHKVPVPTTNYLTAILDDKMTWTDLMRMASTDKRMRDFIQKYPDVFEEILPIMGQARSAGIHASALIITPEYVKGERVECFDLLPIRKMGDLLVSEISGVDIDAIGILKNDVLGIRELTRLSDTLQLVKDEYGVTYTILEIASKYLNDEKVFRIIKEGNTQGIFQMSGDGITKFIKRMAPDNINDIIASVALFRPGTLDSGAAENYVQAKRGEYEPTYLWGTYEILNETFGQMCIAHGTMIKTNNGLVEIQNINKGDMVQTEDGTYQMVLKTMYKTRKQVVKLRTAFGKELVCTPDHKVLTQRGWVEVQNLNPKHDCVKAYWMNDDVIEYGTLRDWCVGLYLANGFWGTTPVITCRNNDDAIKIAALFDKAFGLHCAIYFQTRAWYVCCSYNADGKHQPNPFKEYLKELGLDECTCYDKSLNHWTLMTLTGFFEGDGCVANKRIRIKNPKLADQIFMTAQALRIHSSYYEDIENEDVVYTIALTDISMLPFQIKTHQMPQKRCGVKVPTIYVKDIDVRSLPTKSLRTMWYMVTKQDVCSIETVESLGGRVTDCWGMVLSVKDAGYEKTYDLSVDYNHSFVASGLVVHNCYQEQISQVAQKVGQLSLGDGVNLVKALSKKKLEKVRKFKEKFFTGAKANGCPKEAADQIWSNVEDAAKYSFNKCIGGHEYLYGRHKDNGRAQRINIGDMWRTMNNPRWAKENGKTALRRKYKKNGYGKCWSLNEDNNLVTNDIVDIRYMGVRPTYRITLANGKTLDVTDNHKHPTLNGIKRTDELVPGEDWMYIYGGWVKEDTAYRFTDRGGKNDTRYHSNNKVEKFQINTLKGHSGFVSKDTNYTKLAFYEKHLKKTYCEECGTTEGRLEVHHVNGDHSDVGKNFSNLKTLCPSCHKKAHYQLGRTKMGCKGVGTAVVQIISVKYLGELEVFDVEMADPYHTFVTGNGIVTCNSHATAYGLTAYVGAWLKAYYPTAFYTVILRDQDDDKMPILMNEIRAVGGTTLNQPDINISDVNFTADFKNNSIYWSLTRIKQLGAKAVQYIVQERRLYGEFYDLEDFIKRIFKSKFKSWDDEGTPTTRVHCPVTARSVRNLIFAGAFDKVEHVGSLTERYGLMEKAATLLGFAIAEKDVPEALRDKHYFWSQQQINVSGMGSIDYRRIYDNFEKPNSMQRYKYIEFKELTNMFFDVNKGVICATICEVHDKSYKDRQTGETKHFGKIDLQQNTDTNILTIWDDWSNLKKELKDAAGRIIVAVVNVKWSDYDEKNTLQINKCQFLKLV